MLKRKKNREKNDMTHLFLQQQKSHMKLLGNQIKVSSRDSSNKFSIMFV